MQQAPSKPRQTTLSTALDGSAVAPTSEWVYLNGVVQPLAEARIGLEDRGFHFADGVYEVIRVYNGKPFTLPQHLDRLQRSADGILLRLPLARAELARQIEALVERSGLSDAMVYLQLTRGQSPRDHEFPKNCPPTLLFYVRALAAAPTAPAERGLHILSVADERWKRCWIKSIALLPNVLAKNQALSNGFDEAVFIDDGIVTEGSSTNFFAVIDGDVVTHPVGAKVLPGITRLVLSEIAVEKGIRWIERPLLESEARAAQEVFITSTTRELAWVARWDGRAVCEECGPVTRLLHAAYQARVAAECGRS